jgi:hypothetical protein
MSINRRHLLTAASAAALLGNMAAPRRAQAATGQKFTVLLDWFVNAIRRQIYRRL